MQSASIPECLKLMSEARNILVLANEEAPAKALSEILHARKKPHTIVAPGFDGKLERMRSFVIGVDISKTELASFAHEQRDGKIYLRVTPKNGLISKQDIEIGETEWRFDLVIQIGEVEHREYKEFFESVKTILLPSDIGELIATL